MAEAFVRLHGAGLVEVYCAGFHPAENVHAKAVTGRKRSDQLQSRDPQALRLMNSGQFLGPRSEAFITKQMVEPGATPAQAVERLYLRVLSRRPSEVGSQRMLKYLEQPGAPRQQLYAKIVWPARQVN